MKELFDKLLQAYRQDQVLDVLQGMPDSKIRFEPVGGRRNNLATINIGSDPAAGVTERITNAIDAVLESEFILRNQADKFKTPRGAVESWFGIEGGRISKILDAQDSRIKQLSALINVTLLESGSDSKPTVEIRDKGLGIRPEEFSRSIVDLNGSNKIGKLHLMGAYGQGGSTALSYNNLTIIISRPRFVTETEKKCAAWTIVRINPGDVNQDKHEWYEYMVETATGQPFCTDVTDDEFEAGTLVRHIAMDLGKYRGPITTPQRSLWYLSNNYLFDPVVPFTISDRRNGKNDKRTVTGNNRLLTNTDNREYFQEVNLSFRNGKVILYYWVLNTSGEKPRERIVQYVEPSHPILITFNGQKQGCLPSSLIKNKLKFPFLDRYLIVQIEADNLDNDSKRQLFSSTRESLRDTSILEELKELTIDTLADDLELKRLDRERKERYFSNHDTDVRDSLRKRLASRINAFLRDAGSGGSVTATPKDGNHTEDRRPAIPVENPPTLFEITTRSPKRVPADGRFSIRFRTDADPNYFCRTDTFVAFVEPHGIAAFTGASKVVNGYGNAFFRANSEAQIGDLGRVALELRPPNQRSMTSTVDIEIVEPQMNMDPRNRGSAKTPNIIPIFVYRNDDYFLENGWNDESVADVQETADDVTIYVSAENRNLTRLVSKAQRSGDTAVENIRNKYLEHISFYAFIWNRTKIDDLVAPADSAPISEEVVEKIRLLELVNASETVCGMIQDFFDVIALESPENAIAA